MSYHYPHFGLCVHGLDVHTYLGTHVYAVQDGDLPRGIAFMSKSDRVVVKSIVEDIATRQAMIAPTTVYALEEQGGSTLQLVGSMASFYQADSPTPPAKSEARQLSGSQPAVAIAEVAKVALVSRQHAVTAKEVAEQEVIIVYLVQGGLDLCDRFEKLMNLRTAVLCANRPNPAPPHLHLPPPPPPPRLFAPRPSPSYHPPTFPCHPASLHCPSPCYRPPIIPSLLASLPSSPHTLVWILSDPPRHRPSLCLCMFVPLLPSPLGSIARDLGVFSFCALVKRRGLRAMAPGL